MNIKRTLIEKLEGERPKYEESMAELLKDLDYFNSNLLRILGKSERIQKYVPLK